MTEFGWLSLLPPVISIGLALWKRQIIPALFLGVLFGELLIVGGNPIEAFFKVLDRIISVSTDPGNLMLILFSVLVGSLLALIREANGFVGFIHWVEKHNLGSSRLSAYVMTCIIGIVMFLENWSNVLVNGTTVGPLYDKLGISRERLAYFIHTISINVVALVVLNSWGAFYMTLLSGQGVAQPFDLVLSSIPFNFYSIVSLLVVAVVMATGLTIGPMKKAEQRARAGRSEKGSDDAVVEKLKGRDIPAKLLHLAVPLILLISVVLVSLITTGGGDLTRGEGAKSVFYAVVVTITIFGGYLLLKKYAKFNEVNDIVFTGMGSFLPVAALVMLALSLGDITKDMGTGLFIAGVAENNIPLMFLPAAVFALGALMSFATGTSYGTFAIMVPIAVPIGLSTGISPSLLFAACISGGVFGDNCSPISDTSIVSSMAARVLVVDHVKTQLPYALVSSLIALSLFVLAGAMQ